MSAIRPTTYQVQVKIFEAAGCRYVRTQGDHLVYSYPGAMRPVVIPKYQEVPAFIIKNKVLRCFVWVNSCCKYSRHKALIHQGFRQD